MARIRLLVVVCAALVYLEWLPPRPCRAADVFDPREKIVKLAALVEKKDTKEANKQAEAMVLDVIEVKDVMRLFALRNMKGLGVGEKPGLVPANQDGIEAKIFSLDKNQLSREEARSQGAAIAQSAYTAAAIALVAREIRYGGDLWTTSANDMHDRALELADAAARQDLVSIKSAATRLQGSCNSCHEKYRDKFPSAGPPNRRPSDLIAALKDEHPDVRSRAALALGQRGGEAREAIPALIEALKDRKQVVRRNSAEALAIIGVRIDPRFPLLSEALRGEDPYVQFWFTHNLGGSGDDSRRQVTLLTGALTHRDGAIRSKAGEILAMLSPVARPAVPGLTAALNDEDSDVRRSAALALRRIGAEAVVPALIDALHDSDPAVRSQAAIVLGRLGPKAVPALAGVLREKDPRARLSAAYALGRIGPGAKEAASALLELVKDKDPVLGKVAAEALKKIDPDAAANAGIR